MNYPPNSKKEELIDSLAPSLKKKKVIGPSDSWRSSWRAAGLFAFSVANWGTSGFESGNGVLRLLEVADSEDLII